jgi:hypothetical protein
VREREKVKVWPVMVARDPAIVGVKETIFSVLKVPRQCSLDLLARVMLMFRINLKL